MAVTRKPLIIVESPAKTRTLHHFLGDDYDIQASMGHVRDLPASSLGVDVDHDFAAEYVPIEKRKDVLAKLQRAAKKASHVFLASDPDREGEAIAWHLAEAMKLPNPQRVEFNEITKRAVEEGLRHPREIDRDRVSAQQARRILDRLVGYKLSPLLGKKLQWGLSAGRVQSVAVRLVCDREREINRFVSREYWDIFAQVTPVGIDAPFAAKLVRKDGKKVEIGAGDEAAAIVAELQDAAYRIERVKRTEQKRNPSAPFITSSLQQDASQRLGFSARKTMRVAQQLYEGLEIGDEGPVGLITYMRTDSTRVAAEAQQEARKFIAQRFGDTLLPPTPRQYASRKGAQEAHEAIRPSSVGRTPDDMQSHLDHDQMRLYQLIWTRFVASQMASAVLDVMAVDVAAGPYVLRATGSSVKFPGFYALTGGISDREEQALPKELSEGQDLRLLELKPGQHFTEPPPRYSEASLVKELESKGIGRPSTYAPILGTIVERGYVTLEKRRFRPTELGMVVTDQLVRHFPSIMEVGFTADMESKLDEIEAGHVEWVETVRAFYGPFAEMLAKATTDMDLTLEEPCPDCGKPLMARKSRHGAFLGCSAYPECTYTRALDQTPREPSDEICEKCQRPMLIISGKKGRFLGCSGYPECENTKPLGRVAPEPTDEKCEKCESPMVIRSGRRGRFMACSAYPKCKNARPLPRESREESE
jgi:DNA topoisomerase-1